VQLEHAAPNLKALQAKIKEGKEYDQEFPTYKKSILGKKTNHVLAYDCYASIMQEMGFDETTENNIKNLFEYMGHIGKSAIRVRMLYLTLERICVYVNDNGVLIDETKMHELSLVMQHGTTDLLALIECRDFQPEKLAFPNYALNIDLILKLLVNTPVKIETLQRLHSLFAYVDGFGDIVQSVVNIKTSPDKKVDEVPSKKIDVKQPIAAAESSIPQAPAFANINTPTPVARGSLLVNIGQQRPLRKVEESQKSKVRSEGVGNLAAALISVMDSRRLRIHHSTDEELSDESWNSPR
jgi:hypothetical protein